MQLKEVQIQHSNVDQQLGTLKEVVIAKEEICVRKCGEILILQRNILRLDEENAFQKEAADDARRKVDDAEVVKEKLDLEVSSLKTEIEDVKETTRTANARVKVAEGMCCTFSLPFKAPFQILFENGGAQIKIK